MGGCYDGKERVKGLSPTCLCVPQFTVSVVGTAEELSALIVEADVSHGLPVARVRPHTSPVIVHLPDLQQTHQSVRLTPVNQCVISQIYSKHISQSD